MRIVVCVKQIEHIYARTGMDASTHFIAEEDRVSIINPLDELAVEEAVRLREARGGEVVLMTLGALIAERGLRHCFAMGADRMIRIDDSGLNARDAWTTAVLLSAAICRLGGADLVLCGKEALDDRSGQVGLMIAERLDLPCVCGITLLELQDEGNQARVHRARERGDREVVECPLPAVFTVERGLNEPRYPPLDRLLDAGERAIEDWDVDALEIASDLMVRRTRVVKLTPPKPRTKRVAAPASSLSAQDRIQMLMGGGAGKRKKKEDSKLVELPPREAAERVLEFLAEKKFV
jgi:electron transfer flavoprotein beta subunit